MISFTLSIYSVSEWRQYLRWDWETPTPPPPLHPDRKYTRNMGLFKAKSTSLNLVADTSNVCTVDK